MSEISDLEDDPGIDASLMQVPMKKLRSNTRAMFASGREGSQRFWSDERRQIERMDAMRKVTVSLPKLKFMEE